MLNPHPPFAAPSNYINGLEIPELHPEVNEAYWFIFSGDQLFVSSDNRAIPSKLSIPLKRKLYLGTFEGKHLFAGEAENRDQIFDGWIWNKLRTLYGAISDEQFALAGRAMQLIDWDRSNVYCGACGKETVQRKTERCRECTSCGHLSYPKLAPAIMVLVKKGDKLLLARGPHFPEKFYSVLAGYVDPGETLEQCVAREVFEEVGLEIKNIRYFGSQPWPFTNSLMIAFTCDWQAGEIHIDPQELTDAAWFEPSNLPQLPPLLSISRMLIDAHFEK